MGVLNDVWRLIKAGGRERANIDYAESLRQSADLAEAMAGTNPGGPGGTHGAAAPNPFTNLEFMRQAIPVAGTVVALAPTDQVLGGTPIYAVELDVLRDGAPVYRTTYRTVIAAGALHNWQPGKVLPFRVSPTDPHALMLG